MDQEPRTSSVSICLQTETREKLEYLHDHDPQFCKSSLSSYVAISMINKRWRNRYGSLSVEEVKNGKSLPDKSKPLFHQTKEESPSGQPHTTYDDLPF
jgi:hypothetical protein